MTPAKYSHKPAKQIDELVTERTDGRLVDGRMDRRVDRRTWHSAVEFGCGSVHASCNSRF